MSKTEANKDNVRTRVPASLILELNRTGKRARWEDISKSVRRLGERTTPCRPKGNEKVPATGHRCR